jgi:putative ABC transport system substrate-binding protein
MAQLEERARAEGFEFEKIGIATTSDVADAGITLASLDLDVWAQITDNLIASSYPAIMESSRRARLPVITFAPVAADFGALLIVARDYYDTGVEQGLLAARVLRGENIAKIPFTTTPTLSYIVNLKTASDYGISVPQDMIDQARQVIR